MSESHTKGNLCAKAEFRARVFSLIYSLTRTKKNPINKTLMLYFGELYLLYVLLATSLSNSQLKQ